MTAKINCVVCVLFGLSVAFLAGDAGAFSMNGALQVHSTLHEPFSAEIACSLDPGEETPQVQVLAGVGSDYVGSQETADARTRLSAKVVVEDAPVIGSGKGRSGRILITGVNPEPDSFFTLLLRVSLRDVSFMRNDSVVLDAFPTTGVVPTFPVQASPAVWKLDWMVWLASVGGVFLLAWMAWRHKRAKSVPGVSEVKEFRPQIPVDQSNLFVPGKVALKGDSEEEARLSMEFEPFDSDEPVVAKDRNAR
ncbi:MAG: hypothetical protein HQL94_02045 [Magnetococcales bacterium]|nr:hypothetical protein [Magnetococcales bacterium]MBF0440140.1 hypothetical protein [Magnetococcales bacterium]